MTALRLLPHHLLLGCLGAILAVGCGALELPGSSADPGAGLTATPEPAWVQRPDDHPAAASGEYLVQVGSAPGRGAAARDTALKRGLQGIAASILAEVKSEVVTQTRSLVTEDQAAWSEELSESIFVGAEADLPGAEILATHEASRPKETILLVGAPRARLVENWLPQLDSALNAAEELDRSAAESSANLARRLVLLAQAQATVSDSWILANKLRVVSTRTPQARFVQDSWSRSAKLMTTLSTEVTRAASRVRLSVVSGDGQLGRVRGALADPLVVRAEQVDDAGASRPIPGLALSFVAGAPGLAVLQAEGAVTDPHGQLSARVTSLNRVADAPLEIVVRPTLPEGLPTPPGLPSASFAFSLPGPAETRVVVAVREEFSGDVLDTSTLADGLSGHLGSYGFDAQQLELRDARLDAVRQAPAGELRALLTDDVDYVLRGHANVRATGLSGGLHWFRGRGVLEIVDLDDGSVLPLTTEERKNAHSTSGPEGVQRLLRLGLLPDLFDLLDEQYIVGFVGENGLR